MLECPGMFFRGSAALLFLVSCTTLKPVPAAWRSGPVAPRITDICTKVGCAEKATSDAHVVDGKLVAGGRELTQQFRAIQSFDVSLERREVVFSAKRTDNFDIGLVSLDGSEIHWIPADPADETDVQWAPRGNKISYVVHSRTGDLVRTVHIPTSLQLTADFPYSAVRVLAWEPQAERYAVVLTTPNASERVERLKYSGEGRETVVAPAVRLDTQIEPLGGAFLMRPSAIHYGERIPLVVWITEAPLAWNDALGNLNRDARVASAIMSVAPSEAFWTAASAVQWIDMNQVFVVRSPFSVARGQRTTDNGQRTGPTQAIWIIPDESRAPDRYAQRKNTLLVSPTIVESFAAAWIAQQLKDRNGRR
jgi:hypothetical protein